MAAGGTLLMMTKPDGFGRICTANEVAQVWHVWADVLAWLGGTDHADLEQRTVVDQVAQKAGLRSVRLPEYDIRLWAAQASDLPRLDIPPAAPQRLADLGGALLGTLGFAEQSTPRFRGWLNRVVVEMLYGDAPVFHGRGGRAIIVPTLLDGPVEIGYWGGGPRELALAVKLVLRLILIPATSPPPTSRSQNLIHVEAISDVEHRFIDAALREMAALGGVWPQATAG